MRDALRTVDDYRRWLGSHEFPEAARVLDNLYAELNGEALNAGSPGESDNCVISKLREQLRRRREAAEGAVQQASGQAEALRDMEARKDAAYLERNQVVAALASAFPSGIARTAIEGWSEDWHGCVYIDLPTGQASWHYHDSHAHLFEHLPPYGKPWDGHTTEEKYRRLAALATSTSPIPAEAAGEPDLDRVLSIADAHAEESREDGMRVLDRGGLLQFAKDVLGVWATPAEAKPAAQKARDLSDEDMDAVLRAIRELETGDLGFHAFCDRIIDIARVQPDEQVGEPTDEQIRKVYQDACDYADRLQQGFSYGRMQALRAVFEMGRKHAQQGTRLTAQQMADAAASIGFTMDVAEAQALCDSLPVREATNLPPVAIAEKCGAEVGRYKGEVVWVKFHTQSAFEAFASALASPPRAIPATPAQVQPAESCYCDRNNLGNPGVSCGDCPARDYKQPAEQVGVKYVPVQNDLRDKHWNHPNDDEPRTPECVQALKDRGDSEGQGIDGYWKWGFAAGFNAALATPAPQQPVSAETRDAARWHSLCQAAIDQHEFVTVQPSGYNGGDHAWIEFGFKHPKWTAFSKDDIDRAIDAALSHPVPGKGEER